MTRTGRTCTILILSTALAGVLAGCSTGLQADAPADVRLEGPWKLDRGASDDPEKVLSQLRSAVAKRMHRHNGGSFAMGGGHMGRHGMQGQSSSSEGDDEDSGTGPRSVGDALNNSVTMQALMSFIRRGEYLTVKQTPEVFQVNYGDGAQSYTPGQHSVVSDETGVADQVSGWKGKEYVIDVKPQVGPAITEEYGLSDDHQHLIVKLHVAAGDLPAVNLKQVYDRTTQIAPPEVPST